MKNRILCSIVAGAMLGGTAFAQGTAEAPGAAPVAEVEQTPAEVAPDASATTPTPAPAEPMAEPMTEPATDPAAQPAAEPMAPVGTPADIVVSVPEGYVLTEVASMTAEQLKGVDIHDPSDKKIAEIADVVIGSDNAVTGIVTDVGGFLGMGEHRVSLSPEQVSIYKNGDDALRAYVSMSKDELKALPAYEAPNP